MWGSPHVKCLGLDPLPVIQQQCIALDTEVSQSTRMRAVGPAHVVMVCFVVMASGALWRSVVKALSWFNNNCGGRIQSATVI